MVALYAVREHSSYIWEPSISHTFTLVVSHTHRTITDLPVLSPLPQPILLPSFQSLVKLCVEQVSEIEAGKKVFIPNLLQNQEISNFKNKCCLQKWATEPQNLHSDFLCGHWELLLLPHCLSDIPMSLSVCWYLSHQAQWLKRDLLNLPQCPCWCRDACWSCPSCVGSLLALFSSVLYICAQVFCLNHNF